METTVVNAEDFGLEKKTAVEISNKFAPSIEEREGLAKIYGKLITKELSYELVQEARELRLKLVKVRTGIASIHKTQKDFYLAGGRFVDAWKNKETLPVTQMEEKLTEIEKHFENLEKEKIEKIRVKRTSELEKYEVEELPDNLGTMSEDSFQALLVGFKTMHENKIAAAKKLEEERIENERLDKQAQTRRNELAPYVQFISDNFNYASLRSMTDKDYDALLSSLRDARLKYDEEQFEIQQENLKLKEQAEAKEKARLKEQEAEEMKQEALRKLNEEKLKNERREKETAEAALKAKEKEEEEVKEQAAKEEEDRLKAGDSEQFDYCMRTLEEAKITANLKSAKYQKLGVEVNELIDRIIKHVNGKK